MHRDAKLGLALGILVIGFAAAFCFPRHAGLPARGPTALEAQGTLDERLALRSVKVYTTARHPSETILPLPASSLPIDPPSTDLLGNASTAPGRSPSDNDQEDSPAVAGMSSVFGRRGPALEPEPERLTQSDNPFDDAPPVETTYTVHPGDTLSSIAQKLLGSAGRYNEVFEANRDLLGSPDALQIGMALKIPSRERQPTPPRSPVSGPTQIADSRTDEFLPRRFRPSRDSSLPPATPTAPAPMNPTPVVPAPTPPSPAAGGAGTALPTSAIPVPAALRSRPSERQPTLAEPPLPTTSIPAPGARGNDAPASPPPAPRTRLGAASVGASLRNRATR